MSLQTLVNDALKEEIEKKENEISVYDFITILYSFYSKVYEKPIKELDKTFANKWLEDTSTIERVTLDSFKVENYAVDRITTFNEYDSNKKTIILSFKVMEYSSYTKDFYHSKFKAFIDVLPNGLIENVRVEKSIDSKTYIANTKQFLYLMSFFAQEYVNIILKYNSLTINKNYCFKDYKVYLRIIMEDFFSNSLTDEIHRIFPDNEIYYDYINEKCQSSVNSYSLLKALENKEEKILKHIYINPLDFFAEEQWNKINKTYGLIKNYEKTKRKKSEPLIIHFINFIIDTVKQNINTLIEILNEEELK